MRVQWVHHIHISNGYAPTNRYKQFLKLWDGSLAQPCSKVKMWGDAILIASSFVFHFVFCDRNHIPWAHAYRALLLWCNANVYLVLWPGQVLRLKDCSYEEGGVNLHGLLYQWLAKHDEEVIRGNGSNHKGLIGYACFSTQFNGVRPHMWPICSSLPRNSYN